MSRANAGRAALYGLFLLASTWALMELALRVAPQAIPAFALVRFHPEVRSAIGKRLGLPTLEETIILPRDDGGPRLRVFKPYAEFGLDFEERDATHQFTVDEIGFCNERGLYDGHETFDVIAIGDSFTWCTAVEARQAWPALVRDNLGATTYNLGRSGMGLYEYLQILKTFGLEKRPKIVIMNVYEGNDLRDAIRYHRHREKYSDRPEKSDESAKGSFLRKNSYALNLVSALYKESRSKIKNRDSSINFRYSLQQDEVAIPFNLANSDTNEVEHARLIAEDAQVLDRFDEAIAAFADLARKHDFAPLVTYSPSAHTTYVSEVVFEDPSLADVVRGMSDAQRRYFRDACVRHGLPFLDLTETLRAAARPLREDTLLHFPFNLHYSQRGHDIVQQAIVRFIGRRPEMAARLNPSS